MATTKKSKAPSGLQISRSDVTEDGVRWFGLTCSWKQGETYETQEFWYRRKLDWTWEKWQKVPIAASATQYVLWHRYHMYYPYPGHPRYNGVEICVAGKAPNEKDNNNNLKTTKTLSEYKYYTFDIVYPDNVKNLEYQVDSQHSNIGTFVWEPNYESSGKKICSLFQYQLLGSYKQANGSIINDTWGEIKTKELDTPQVKVTEDVYFTDSPDISYFKRGIRVRQVGPDGNGYWSEKYYYFSKPVTPSVVSGLVTVLSASTARIDVRWNTDRSIIQPIDSVNIEYLVDVPDEGFKLNTSSSGWTTFYSYVPFETERLPLSETVGISHDADGLSIPLDKVVWLRVIANHDSRSSYSKPFAANLSKASSPSGMKGILTDPTFSNPIVSPFSIGEYDSELGTTSITYSAGTISINSSVQDAEVKILFRYKNSNNKWVDNNVLGYLKRNELSGSPQSFTIKKDPEKLNSFQLGIQNVQTTNNHETINMASNIIWISEKKYPAPKNFSAETTFIDDTVKTSWNTDIPANVTSLILSWADHEDAWHSTNGPSEYSVYDVYRGNWNISGLSADKKYYIRSRFLYSEDEDNTTYSNWSDIVSVRIPKYTSSSDENFSRPLLTLSENFMPSDGFIDAYWSYSTKLGETQVYAELSFMNIGIDDNNKTITKGDTIATTSTENSIRINAKDLINKYDLEQDQEYYISVRVASSGSTYTSDWSEPVPFVISNPTEVYVFTSLEETQTEITIDDVDDPEGTFVTNDSLNVLNNLPLTIDFNLENSRPVYPVTDETPSSGLTEIEINVTETEVSEGVYEYTISETTDDNDPVDITNPSGDGIEVSVVVERSVTSTIVRPDGSTYEGHEGETVFSSGSLTGLGRVVIDRNNIVGRFDDGCWYRIVVSTKNQNGQVYKPDPIEFMVDWAHDATMPTAEVLIDSSNYTAEITPGFESGEVPEGDTFEIYRLSSSNPQLIATGDYGETFVDPYPSFGRFGGYRIVDVTSNGDYTTDVSNGNAPAWYDYTTDEGYRLDVKRIVINFNDKTLILKNNLTYNNSWSKDFRRTSYLGGSVIGGWNKAVTMDSSANTIIPVFENDYDHETISLLKELAEWPRACHVRTPDGGSYQADVQVTEDRSFDSLVASYSINIQKIDPDGLEAIPLSVWQEEE